MRHERITLSGTSPGQRFELSFLRFGAVAARPLAYIQAGLHADEAPGMLVAHHLRQRLERLEAEGGLAGSVVLVPVANPIGLSQQLLGSALGRFALADGVNFNRAYPDLGAAAVERLRSRLGADAPENARLVRAALQAELRRVPALRPIEHLKCLLLAEALEAETVLDLHCDSEAAMHLYTAPEQAEAFRPLAARLGAKALLTAEISGGEPFDEAVSRPWRDIARAFPDLPFPPAPIATTVELRGERDVAHDLAAADSEAILGFLADRGVLARAMPPPAGEACPVTPLAGSEALEAPVSGLIHFHREVGEIIQAGMLVAEIVEPLSGQVTPVRAGTSGVLFARTSVRFAQAGRKLGKIAGETPFRSGSLLSP